jgi:predicted GNAT family acetyltransferase
MEIKHQIETHKGIFYVEENGERLAELTYRMSGTAKMIIDHTEVSTKLAGKGIGKQLVAKAIEYARANKIKILPICSFAKAKITVVWKPKICIHSKLCCPSCALSYTENEK